MFTVVHRVRVFSLAILCALLFLNALPTVARSQEEGSATATATTTEMAAEAAPAPQSANPYKTDKLLGDQVVGDFVLGPGRVELTMNPGESRTVELTVSNRIGREQEFVVDVEDASGSTDPGKAIVLLGEDRGPYSLKDYLSVPQERFTLSHNTRARVPVTVTIPSDAEPGGLYGSVLVKTVSVRADDARTDETVPSSAIVSRIGTLFFITIPGDVAHEGELKDLTAVPEKLFYQSGPINFGILFENTGSIHLAPYGELRITNMLGEEVGFVELDPWFVLPQSIRLREVSWNREWLMGRYTVTAQINRSYDDVIDIMEYSFWVLPWKILLAVFIGLFVVLFLIRAFLRTFEFKRKGK